MYIDACKKQTLFVLLASLLFIFLCLGGMWAHVKSADAQTGITEASQAKIPEEDEITIIREKYDNFPPHQETDDTLFWCEGFGLMQSEKERLSTLKEAYANGLCPMEPAPATPVNAGVAILPIDPDSFGGMREYYFLPKVRLTDEQLLQLIAYGEESGTPFTAETLTVKNSMRGSDWLTNRQLSAGEAGRWGNLSHRASQEGLKAPDSGIGSLALPLSGVAYIPLNPNTYGLEKFALYPLRELTDEELLLDVYKLRSGEGYTYLNPAAEANLNQAANAQSIRALLEDVTSVPIWAKMTRISYSRKDSTGDIQVTASSDSARINGLPASYTAIFDWESGQPIYIDHYVDDLAFRENSDHSETLGTTKDMYDPR